MARNREGGEYQHVFAAYQTQVRTGNCWKGCRQEELVKGEVAGQIQRETFVKGHSRKSPEEGALKYKGEKSRNFTTRRKSMRGGYY